MFALPLNWLLQFGFGLLEKTNFLRPPPHHLFPFLLP